jgi:hypothetical protein
MDRTGSKVGSVTLSGTRMVVGIGARTVCVIRTDADDIQHLEAYR